MNEQPYFRTDHLAPPRETNFASPADERVEHRAAVATASREASEREMGYARALGGSPRLLKPELPSVKTAELPSDFAERVEELDAAIYERGISVDADKVVSLGKQRFEQLLTAERKARGPGHVVFGDLTRFENVQRAMHAFEAPSVPRRTTSEQLNGARKERETARAITTFAALWKFSTEEPVAVRNVYECHDLFCSIAFGQSILGKLGTDGRLRSHFFCGGKGAKVGYFHDWLSVAQGSFTNVQFIQPRWHLMAWLADERTESPDPVDLSRNWFGLRVPSKQQVRIAQAVLDGYLLGLREWELWEHVGRATRCATNMERLSAWHKELATRCPRITAWHDEVRRAFFKDVGFGYESHREFDAARHRTFIDTCVQNRLKQISALLALGIEETFSGTVVGRFQDWVLVKGKHKLKDKCTNIGLPLAKAFPAASFPLALGEVKP